MIWKIPLSDIDFDDQEIEAATKVLKSRWLTMGEITQQFEAAFAQYLGSQYAFAVSSGTAALHMALRALNIGEGDEVICPALTFVATSNAILYTGATPVFADITSLDDFNISCVDIYRKITPKTKAIIVVHYGGYPCDMDKIMQIAKEYNLYVVEDAAHAPGAEYKGKKCGTIGNVGCFSFFSNKNMVTGEGGMLTTNSGEIAEKEKLLRSHGMTSLTLDRHKGHASSYDVVDLGYNYRIDEVRSAVGLIQLKKLAKNNRKREFIADKYRERLKDAAGCSIPFQLPLGKPSHHIFPILVNNKERDSVMGKLKEHGIQTSIHYPPIHLFKLYRDRFSNKEGMLPLTEQVGKKEMTLPLYPMMTEADIEYVTSKVKESL